MNLLQRALGRRRFSVPDEVDVFGRLYGYSGRPVNGEREISAANLEEVVQQVYKQSGPVFSLIAVRMLLLSEARFQWQRMADGRPGGLFHSPALEIFDQPWPNGTTGDLIKRMEQDVSLLGNAFITNRTPGRLRRLRPDWVTLVFGSDDDPDLYGDALDAELLAYIYTPRLPGGGFGDGQVLFPEEVAHYAPYPDPEANHRGMSWITPVLREIQADNAALAHKNAFFRNGATPRMAMRVDPSVDKESFQALVAMMEAEHVGAANAYKTLYVGGGADPVPMTVNLRDLDFKNVQGGGESRLAAAAGVPPTIVGFSEGLAGSALNAGNYQQTKRRLGDGTLRPLWRDMAGSLATIVEKPDEPSRLWYDDRDIAFLRDDSKDAAEIATKHATTIRTLTDAGFEPNAAIAAVISGDFTSLTGQHTGLFSVQLQPPGKGQTNNNTPPEPAPDDAKATA